MVWVRADPSSAMMVSIGQELIHSHLERQDQGSVGDFYGNTRHEQFFGQDVYHDLVWMPDLPPDELSVEKMVARFRRLKVLS